MCIRKDFGRTEEIIAVECSVKEDPNELIRHRAQELQLCPSTLDYEFTRSN